MINERIAAMTEEIVEDVAGEQVPVTQEDDIALTNVDQAIDTMIAAVRVMDENLPKVKVDNVPQKAAISVVQDLMDTAVKPYLADVAKAMDAFGE
jgi:hypothetical protein